MILNFWWSLSTCSKNSCTFQYYLPYILSETNSKLLPTYLVWVMQKANPLSLRFFHIFLHFKVKIFDPPLFTQCSLEKCLPFKTHGCEIEHRRNRGHILHVVDKVAQKRTEGPRKWEKLSQLKKQCDTFHYLNVILKWICAQCKK